ncbi:MAG: hypothetical protein QOJ96_3321, partial [Alphaproteobacteria bacterium]|nr:hypothetical protein [Alphaproteobacteria bacterium]
PPGLAHMFEGCGVVKFDLSGLAQWRDRRVNIAHGSYRDEGPL